ncbi:MAG: phosphoribosyltransferase [Alphaproteobacteria bacterium CG_4_9_14_3_um_filter_47_13]|nr:MAG: phosphoribosyltransferase [Alphaproteobacteria bacterium CG_4_9_14_3_um_filter_47_13]
MMIFEDRQEAGRLLAEKLEKFRDEHPVILALPRGGLSVGLEIAKALDAPLDVVLVRKIGMPGHKELAAGAIVDGDEPELVLNEEIVRLYNIPARYLEDRKKQQLAEIERRRKLYLEGRPPLSVEGKTAIIVDDGIATGSTMRAAVHAIKRRKPKRVVVAVPIAPAETIKKLTQEADEVVCLDTEVVPENRTCC